jgi:hydrogenase maturation protease
VRALVIAIGNRLRADDGVAHRVADLLQVPSAKLRRVHQLTPEIAADMQDAETVVFIDADPRAEGPSLERIAGSVETAGFLSHSMTPETLVAMASRLYGFHGEAWICRLCARDFSPSTEISDEAAAQLEKAAQLVEQLLEARCTSPR